MEWHSSSQSAAAVANYLDGRAAQHATIKSHLWLGNTHALGLHHGVVLQNGRSDSLRHSLDIYARRKITS